MDIIIAAISGQAVINTVIWLIIAAVIFWIINTVINRIPMDAMVKQVIYIILLLGVAIICINALLTLVGKGFISW